MHTNVKKVMKIMEEIAPVHLAEAWDNVGLLIGRENKMVENILLALEVTEEVIDEAIEKNIDMIITHHPLIFKGLKKVNDKDPIAKMVLRLIENNINLYSAHTNLDSCDEGTSNFLANELGLENLSVLEESYDDTFYKLEVYVPLTDEEKLRQALTKLGLGEYQGYSKCTFNTKGTGRFQAGQGSNPHIGEIGLEEAVEEVKIEGIVHENQLDDVLHQLIKTHPYEVPAYNVLKLENSFNPKGIGLVGIKQTDVETVSQNLKRILNSDFNRIVGDPSKKVSKIAIVTGAGADYIKIASKKADLLITGDLKYHEAHMAKQVGLTVIDAGHYETEVIYMSYLKNILDQRFEVKSYDIKVMVSDLNINPFQVI